MPRDQRRLRHWPISNEYSNFAKAKPEQVSDDVTRKIAPLDFTQKYFFPHRGSILVLLSSWLIFYILFNIILQGSGTSIINLVAWFCSNWSLLIATLNFLKIQLNCYLDCPHLVPSIISLRGLKSKCGFYWKSFWVGPWSAVQCTEHLKEIELTIFGEECLRRYQ